ncbi:metal-sensing transcriptional repressor [Zavarzinia marina]|uniref:metal-sensing transcriptional repressor n=1 Tax=Zavarzinia marina TaxID=2911065 RepID=UPI002E30F866|nr:metal-sensing transcriptional repressor [Zavarzinia marina]
MKHESHVDVAKRLKRSEGRLRKVIRMIEDGRPCTELALWMITSLCRVRWAVPGRLAGDCRGRQADGR